MSTGFEFDDEQREILLGFVEEGREMLDDVEPLLVELEQLSEEAGEIDYETINTVFRLFHSLKGGAGFLGLSTVSSVTHEAETLLDLFRKGKGQIASHHIDLWNKSCDFLRELLEHIEENMNDEGFDDEASALIETLQEMIRQVQSGESAPPPGVDKTGQKSEVVAEVSVKKEDQGEDIILDFGDEGDIASPPVEQEEVQADSEPPLIDPSTGSLLATPEMVEAFVTEAAEQLDAAESALLALESDPEDTENINQAFRAFHSFKGNAGFLGYQDFQTLGHNSETVLDKVRNEKKAPPSQVLSLLLEIIDFLRGGVNQVSGGGSDRVPAASGLVSLLKDAVAGTGASKPKIKEETEDQASDTPVVEDIKPEIAEDEEEPDEVEPSPTVVQAAVTSVNAKQEKAPDSKAKAEKPKADVALQAAQKSKKVASARQSVRVDVEKLDLLLDLIGELVIIETMVAQSPDIKQIDVPLERFERSVLQLDKITRDIQDIATSIRMIPLAGTFRRMMRLVRDVSQKANKKVELQLAGEETEVDKTVIEQITDPLVHIIRNSVDHGLEGPDERREVGKKPVGQVLLEAKYVGGEVWILVIDDGRGLNREKILSKAIERGLIDGDGSDMPDEKVWQLIFQPGFSTAAKVTDISGRGVGMDVVRRNIENIRGKVDVKSREGQGTTVILRIPLTLAIIDGMLVRVGNTRYILPIIAIQESLKVTRDQRTELMDGTEVLKIRDKLLPVVHLGEFFNVEADYGDLVDGTVMIVEHDMRQVCLIVDEIVGQQQVVIKGLSDYIGKVGHVHGISGCTILGDGTISLIMDIGSLIDSVQISSSDVEAAIASERGEV